MRDAINENSEELKVVFDRVVFLSKDETFLIGSTQDGGSILGKPCGVQFVNGVTYRLIGKWKDDEKYGPQFLFKSAIQETPATRNGVVEYLKKYAPGVGQVIAEAICDKFGPDKSIDKLKNDPASVAMVIRGLSGDRAEEASRNLIKESKLQETRVRLLDLLADRGIGDRGIQECIKKWGAHAPDVVKGDPFKLMTARIPRAGFLTCDRLWHLFGLPPDKMKRQVMAAWEHLRSDSSGSTWYLRTEIIKTIEDSLTGNVRPERALKIAVRARMLVEDEVDGQVWIADRMKGNQEILVSDCLREIVRGRPEYERSL